MYRIDAQDWAVGGLITLLIVLTVVEMVLSYIEHRKYYETRDTWTNIYVTSLAFIINIVVKAFTFFILSFAWQFRFFEIHNAVAYWITLVVLQDFLYWVLHYTGHYCRLFWAMHVTHHSSEHFNLTTGFRSTVFEPLYRVFFYMPLAFIGFNALDILYAYMVTQLYGNIVHTQYKINLPRWYGYIFVTPSHHRVHHASNIPYLDKNMGMMFIVWDRMFGTFQEENIPEPIRYGLTKQPEHLGPVDVLFHEWRALLGDVKKAPGFKNKVGYFFHPPGWSHDGSTQTARVLQREYREQHAAIVPMQPEELSA